MNIKVNIKITDEDEDHIIYDGSFYSLKALEGFNFEEKIEEYLDSWYKEIAKLEKIVTKKKKERKIKCKKIKKNLRATTVEEKSEPKGKILKMPKSLFTKLKGKR